MHSLLTVCRAVCPVVRALISGLALLSDVQRVHRVPQAVDGVLELHQIVDNLILGLS